MNIFKGFDFVIFLAAVIITIFGLTMIWSLEPSLLPSQLTAAFLGFLVFFLFFQLDLRIFENLSPLLYLFCLALLIFTFILGNVTRGAVRWLNFGYFTLQTSELVKPFLIISLASLLTRSQNYQAKSIFLWLLLMAFPLFLVLKQPDLGSSLVLAAGFFGISLSSRLPKSYLLIGFILIGVFSPIALLLLESYQKTRLLSFLNPYNDPLGSGYHLIQSVLAVGSGGLFGKGLGKGTQSHLAFLPEHHTDFIFASLAEELGFFGALVLIACYFFLLYRILKNSQNAASNLGKLVGYGIFTMLLFQIFVNIGMNTGIMPVTGITLPLVSYGGSSFLSTMILLGIVESIAKSARKEGTIEIK